MRPSFVAWALYLASGSVHAAVTIYSQRPLGLPTSSVDSARHFYVAIQAKAGDVAGLSIPQKGSFYGFSVEMSVISQILGKNSTHLQVPFLNLMGNLQQRGGAVHVRLGGNTQEFAALVPELSDGKTFSKENGTNENTSLTPNVVYTLDLFEMMKKISALVNVKWYLGVPFKDTTNWQLQIVEHGQAALGDNLLGLQAGNEPDLYAAHGQRVQPYGPSDYFGEFGSLINAIEKNPAIPHKNMLIGPSLATGDWIPEQVWDTGFIPAYSSSLSALAVEHYPNNNCFAQFGIGAPKNSQEEFHTYLNHTAGQLLLRPYLNSSAIAQAAGKPFLMFETNTASCGGFPGISDSFGAALWALDYGMQMAYSNFSGAMLHVGGQNVYYNPFTSPPTSESSFHKWTVGAIYYSTLVMAEAFGLSNTSRIVDLLGNEANIYTPQYAIYENDVLSKVALFNYVSDPSGANDYRATIQMQGGTVPKEVVVKYLASDSVANKFNITWAGQTLGSRFEVDGRLKGNPEAIRIACDQTLTLVPFRCARPALHWYSCAKKLCLRMARRSHFRLRRTPAQSTQQQ
ncbi:hypothetical protein BD779DRAFT_1669853 [Infundibulicybe gibba]|nr:hypothetical protein BD779DRAFT_1669853 [Infundibulicybe gibba]